MAPDERSLGHTDETFSTADDGLSDLLPQSIAGLLDAASVLARRAVAEYAPLVDSIVRDGSRDAMRIERTLDGLLDFCYDADALLLYKKLCRYYFSIDPAAVAAYVRAYRETWDPDSLDGQVPATGGG